MKTALELLGHVEEDDDCCCSLCDGCGSDVVELVAQRAREEMREAAADEALKQYAERRPVLEERKAIAERIRALPVDRVAKLEARLPCAVDCAGFHGADCDDASLQPDGKPNHSPRGGTDQPSPPDAGQGATVQGGGAGGVPAGWKLAPGWREPFSGAEECTHRSANDLWDCTAAPTYETVRGHVPADLTCAAHAVEMGALVKVEPPTERPVSAADELPGASACCRLCGGDVIDIAEHRCPPPCSECGRPTGGCCTIVGPSPVEPSGKPGELPVAPAFEQMVIDGRLCRRGASGWWQWGLAADGMAWLPWEGPLAPPEPASRQGERLSEVVDNWADIGFTVRTSNLRRLAHGIAALEADLAAASEQATAASSRVRALLRGRDTERDARRVAERERDELLRENVRLGAQVDACRISSANFERERNESAARFSAHMENDTCHIGGAVQAERERCLYWFEFRLDGGRGVLLMHREVSERIRNGTPAPVAMGAKAGT